MVNRWCKRKFPLCQRETEKEEEEEKKAWEIRTRRRINNYSINKIVAMGNMRNGHRSSARASAHPVSHLYADWID